MKIYQSESLTHSVTTINDDTPDELLLNHAKTEKDLLLDEIKYLKMRLQQIAYNGDCAYEKKLSDFYLGTMRSCQEKLQKFM